MGGPLIKPDGYLVGVNAAVDVDRLHDEQVSLTEGSRHAVAVDLARVREWVGCVIDVAESNDPGRTCNHLR